MAVWGEISPYFKVKTVSELLPKRGANIYHGGYLDSDKGHVRYANPSSKFPNMMVVNAIYDDNGNVILPGYYELVLSIDRTMLVLMQAGKEVAIVPVFKLEEDKSQEQLAQPMDSKSQRKFDREKKKDLKKRTKMFNEGKIPSIEPEIYMNATIQHDEEGGYYLIKYERDKIRAWGAIK